MKKRLLFIHQDPYLPDVTGGSELSTQELCTLLRDDGITCAVMAPIKPNGRTSIINRAKQKLGIFGRWPNENYNGFTIFRGWDIEEGIPEVIAKFRPNAVLVQGSNPGLGLLAKREGISSFFIFRHTITSLPQDGEWMNLDGFFSNSNFIADHVRNLYKLDTNVIRPPINSARVFTKVVPRYILSFGLQRIKGTEITLDLASSLPDFKFRIIDTWSFDKFERDKLLNRARSLPNVEVCPPIRNVKAYYKEARLLLAPSICEEAWGRVVTEAHVSGIPVLASDKGGLPESVGKGGLCLPGDSSLQSWINAVREMTSNQNYEDWRARAFEASKREIICPLSISKNLCRMIFNHE